MLIKRKKGLAILAVVILALAVLWAFRLSLAEIGLRAYIERYLPQSSYQISALSTQEIRLENVSYKQDLQLRHLRLGFQVFPFEITAIDIQDASLHVNLDAPDPAFKSLRGPDTSAPSQRQSLPIEAMIKWANRIRCEDCHLTIISGGEQFLIDFSHLPTKGGDVLTYQMESSYANMSGDIVLMSGPSDKASQLRLRSQIHLDPLAISTDPRLMTLEPLIRSIQQPYYLDLHLDNIETSPALIWSVWNEGIYSSQPKGASIFPPQPLDKPIEKPSAFVVKGSLGNALSFGQSDLWSWLLSSSVTAQVNAWVADISFPSIGYLEDAYIDLDLAYEDGILDIIAKSPITVKSILNKSLVLDIPFYVPMPLVVNEADGKQVGKDGMDVRIELTANEKEPLFSYRPLDGDHLLISGDIHLLSQDNTYVKGWLSGDITSLFSEERISVDLWGRNMLFQDLYVADTALPMVKGNVHFAGDVDAFSLSLDNRLVFTPQNYHQSLPADLWSAPLAMTIDRKAGEINARLASAMPVKAFDQENVALVLEAADFSFDTNHQRLKRGYLNGKIMDAVIPVPKEGSLQDDQIHLSETRVTLEAALETDQALTADKTPRLKGEFTITGGEAFYREMSMGLQNFEANGDLFYSPKDNDGNRVSADLRLEKGTFFSRASPPMFTDLSATGEMQTLYHLEGGDLQNLSNTVLLELSPVISGTILSGKNITLSYESTPDSSVTKVDTVTFSFSPTGLQPKDIVPSLAVLENVDGAFTGGFTTTAPASSNSKTSGKVSFQDFSFNAGSLSLKGLDFSSSLSAINPLRLQSTDFQINGLELGVAELQEVTGSFSIQPAGAGDSLVILDRVRADFSGGRVVLQPMKYRLSSEQHEGTLEIRSINLKKLFELIGIKGLTGSGKVSGDIPFKIGGDAFGMDEAVLTSDAPGRLSYISEQARKFLAGSGEHMELTLRVLEDFRYEQLTLTLSKPLYGNSIIRLNLKGSNPDVLEGYPFDITINLEGNLSPFLQALKEGQKLSDAIIRDVWKNASP